MRGLGLLTVALCAASAAIALAAGHPIAPVAMVALSLVAMGGAARWPFGVPACLVALLPVASAAPFTGWWLIDEFDLLALSLLAGAYARAGVARRGSAAALPGEGEDHVWPWLVTALAVSGALSLFIGLRDAGVTWPTHLPGRDDWLRALYADHGSAFNPWRVSKSVLWACLLFPLMRQGTQAQQRAMATATVRGLVVGLALVCALVLWERWRYVGLMNVGLSYRTVASFWEMHVGGGAIDAYLAMTAPLAFWSVWLTRGGWRWACAALLAVLCTYAVLTTYSRGLYLAVAVSLVVMFVLAWRLHIRPATGERKRRWALGGLALALLAQSVWVLGEQSFMAGRLAQSESDLADRVAHWQDGLGLRRSSGDTWLGLGAGRLPAHYSERVPGGEFPGRAQWQRGADAQAFVTLAGPASRQDIAYDFGLTQRVDLVEQGRYRVRVRYETDAPVVLLLSVCERHLLYDFRCQWKHVRSALPVTDPTQWQEIALSGQQFAAAGRAVALRDGMFAMTLLSTGQSARIHAVELFDPRGAQVLRNTDFSDGLGHWLAAAQGSFKPWHMDNLYLEVLLERGVLGLAVMGLLAAWALRCVWLGLKERDPLALALAGSLVSMGVLGLVISVTELPRIALILLLVLLTTSHLRRIPQYSHSGIHRQTGNAAVFSGRPLSEANPRGSSEEEDI